jgi:hypothetical protein
MSNYAAEHWFLTDSSEPRNGEISIIPVQNERDLDAKVRGLMQPGYPSVITLNSSNVVAIRIGLGDDYGFVQYYEHDSPAHSHMAVAPKMRADEEIEFYDQGAGEPIWPENLLPMEQVIAVVLEFYRTAALPTSVEWADRVWKDEGEQEFFE